MFDKKKLLFLWSCCFFIALQTEAQVKFIWPLQPIAGFSDAGYYAISNYVDHNNRLGFKRDYNGGYRTYNGHRGTDIRLYPNKWLKKAFGKINVVAAAAGEIIDKGDGFSDNNCNSPNIPGNFIKLRHLDGKISIYLHLKKYSLTAKQVGETVLEGEYLGKVASSGTSTGPHLHFEVRDRNGNVLDPFAGPDNPTTAISLWKNQKPYYDGGVNKVYIGSDFVIEPNPYCYQFLALHQTSFFLPGQRVYTSSFIRTPRPQAVVDIYIFQPSGILFNPNNTHLYSFPTEAAADKGKKRGKALYRDFNLPFNAEIGVWTVMVMYDNQSVAVERFEVKGLNDGNPLRFNTNANNDLNIKAYLDLVPESQTAVFQRSYDGKNWINLEEDINPVELQDWQYIDTESRATDPIVYYRVNSKLKNGEIVHGNVFHWTRNQKTPIQTEENTSVSLRLYPNPTRGALHLTTTDETTNRKVKIVSLTGQVLAQFDWGAGETELKLQVDFLPAGLYAAHIIEKGRKVVKPFVKSE